MTAARDGNKLLWFVTFKSAINGSIANSKQDITPNGVYECIYVKGWILDRVMKLHKGCMETLQARKFNSAFLSD